MWEEAKRKMEVCSLRKPGGTMIPARSHVPVYPKPKPDRPQKGQASVTIAIGMSCWDGVVIGADTEISTKGYYKYHERKVHATDGPGWAFLFGYANHPGLYVEARDKILGKLPRSGFNPNDVYKACDEVFTDMGRVYSDVSLQMLMGVSISGHPPGLLVFDGKSVHWENRICCFGVGDCSLTNYLIKALYNQPVSVEQGQRIAVYVIAKAKLFVDGCGGETHIHSLLYSGKQSGLRPEESARLEKEMEGRENEHLKRILECG
jgi:hypothetical protein